MSYTYFHNPRCSKSRQGLELLKEKGIEPTIKEYLKEGFSKSELSDLFKKLGKEPLEVIRKKEARFKELDLAKKELSNEQWIDVIIENPVLLERPILISEEQAAVGRPPEDLLKITK